VLLKITFTVTCDSEFVRVPKQHSHTPARLNTGMVTMIARNDARLLAAVVAGLCIAMSSISHENTGRKVDLTGVPVAHHPRTPQSPTAFTNAGFISALHTVVGGLCVVIVLLLVIGWGAAWMATAAHAAKFSELLHQPLLEGGGAAVGVGGGGGADGTDAGTTPPAVDVSNRVELLEDGGTPPLTPGQHTVRAPHPTIPTHRTPSPATHPAADTSRRTGVKVVSWNVERGLQLEQIVAELYVSAARFYVAIAGCCARGVLLASQDIALEECCCHCRMFRSRSVVGRSVVGRSVVGGDARPCVRSQSHSSRVFLP
jgi:hypothetical protein